MIRFIYDQEVVHETRLSLPEFVNSPGNSDFRDLISDFKIEKKESDLVNVEPAKIYAPKGKFYKGVTESGRDFVYDGALL